MQDTCGVRFRGLADMAATAAWLFPVERGFSATCPAAPLPPQSGTLYATNLNIHLSESRRPPRCPCLWPQAQAWRQRKSRVRSHARRPEKHSCTTRSIASSSTSRPNTHHGLTKSRFGFPSSAKASSPRQFRQQKHLEYENLSCSSPISTKPWPSLSAGPWKQDLSPVRARQDESPHFRSAVLVVSGYDLE